MIDDIMMKYAEATKEIGILQGRQGLRKDVRISRIQHWVEIQTEAQGCLINVLMEHDCYYALTVARFLCPCEGDIVLKTDMQTARRELTNLLIRGLLTIGEVT